MRYAKALMILFLAVTLVGTIVFTSNDAMAKVGDNVEAVCSVCHTMHHSQDGTDPDNPNTDNQSVGANNALLYGNSSNNNATCVACHTGSGGTHATLGYDNETGAPIVDLAADKQLAGGTYVTATDASRHNALGITGADGTIPNDSDGTAGDIPPGGSNDDIGDVAQITCAGTTGCHGDRSIADNVESVHGAHHTDDRTIDGSSLGESYRFLSVDVVDSAFSAGVDGLEHDHWESGQDNTLFTNNTLNADDHNVYDAEGINKVCASCHGDFHGDTNQGEPEPWLRHPTDITLESAADDGPSAEYDDYPNVAGAERYHTEAPVGFTVAQADGGANVDANDGQVLCISCHRAHGSEYPDILRWCYSDMLATTGDGSVNTGCNRCHTTK